MDFPCEVMKTEHYCKKKREWSPGHFSYLTFCGYRNTDSAILCSIMTQFCLFVKWVQEHLSLQLIGGTLYKMNEIL